MNRKLSPADDLVSALAHHRRSLLEHTASVLSAPAVADRDVQLSAIAASSLEELKVAEEELTERTAALATLRDGFEERLLSAQQLFELAPACLLVTDIYGTILQANVAMRRLLRVDQNQLERQPLARYLPHDQRRGFRDGLSRLATMDGVADWRLTLVRPTDAPVEVRTTISVIRGPLTPSGTALYWSFSTHGEPEPAEID